VIDEREIVRRAAEALTPPEPSFDRLLQRRDRVHRNRRIRAGALGMAVAIAVGWLGVNSIRSTPPVSADRSEELGIFAPVAGRILFVNEDGVAVAGFDPGPWAIDPSGPADTTAGPRVADEVVSTLVPLGPEDAIPLDWSGDGTELLFERMHGDLIVQEDLYLLHSDGSETLLVRGYGGSATIAPDGTRVVFSGACGQPGLCVVDAGGGQPAPLPFPSDKDAYSPTFSPDGTRIAYLVDQDDDLTHVWVADVNGSAAPREILAPEETRSVGAGSLQWSPAGDRLAFGVRGFEGNGDVSSIYTFAPDGSDFTRVITGGDSPYWSPDGSQIAYTSPAGLAIADADGSNVRAFGFAASGPWHPAGVAEIRTAQPPIPAAPPEEPSVDLGIFAPIAGRIVYNSDGGLWAVDPSAPSPASTLVRLDLPGSGDADRFASFTLPLDWSRDGTKLLFLREDPPDDTFPYDLHLYILHADGTETQVVPKPVSAAALSPDGSQVVYTADRSDGLYVVDAEGGQPVRISAFGEEPTFSPDGTQIAFLGLPRSGCCVPDEREHVWVVNADGTDAHEILVNEPALDDGANGLTWSPGDDRIAMDNAREGHVAIYTFASDGSGFTQVVTGGANPFWSPDGSQIAYEVLDGSSDGLRILDADGVRIVGVGRPGPWHPGTPEDGAGG